MKRVVPFLVALTLTTALDARAAKPRARDLGIPFAGTPGRNNAITDVKGVEVGLVTLVRGEGKLVIGKGPVRTGVTAIHPRGKSSTEPVFGAWFSQNGNGELTGTTWLEESGFLEGPIVFTNTHSVGVAHSAVTAWRVRQGKPEKAVSLPVVGETWDGHLNDINGFHVTQADVWKALDGATDGRVAEGNVGGGTGMICYEFKCGTGTSSRVAKTEVGSYTVGALVQANHGLRHQLLVAGIPVGKLLPGGFVWTKETGSILVAIATDAPLLPHQLKRLAKRASMGLARSGAVSGDSSGDIFVAFSTANTGAAADKQLPTVKLLPNGHIDPLFEAVVETVDEAIINAMVAAETMTGVDGHKAQAIDTTKLTELLARHGRLVKPAGE